MTKLLEQAIARARELTEEEQDALALTIFSVVDASAYPVDDATRAAIEEGLEQAKRGEYVSDDVVAEADKRHGI
jgi:hypothetical protein